MPNGYGTRIFEQFKRPKEIDKLLFSQLCSYHHSQAWRYPHADSKKYEINAELRRATTEKPTTANTPPPRPKKERPLDIHVGRKGDPILIPKQSANSH